MDSQPGTCPSCGCLLSTPAPITRLLADLPLGKALQDLASPVPIAQEETKPMRQDVLGPLRSQCREGDHA